MPESKHTPGPWTNPVQGNIVGANGKLIVSVPRGLGAGATERRNADARLIAASPELLEYALLEAEYSYVSNRLRPTWNKMDLADWMLKHGIRADEPIGEWLAAKRNAAIARATGEAK